MRYEKYEPAEILGGVIDVFIKDAEEFLAKGGVFELDIKEISKSLRHGYEVLISEPDQNLGTNDFIDAVLNKAEEYLSNNDLKETLRELYVLREEQEQKRTEEIEKSGGAKILQFKPKENPRK